MCKHMRNNFVCNHFTITDIPDQPACTTHFQFDNTIIWEQTTIPYPCNACITRFENAASTIRAYTKSLNEAFTPILRDLSTCDGIHNGHPTGIYTRQEVRVLFRAFNRCIDRIFAAEKIAEGFAELCELRTQLISDMRHSIEAEESWDALDTLHGLDKAIEARIQQTSDWSFNFSSMIERFVGPFRFTRLVERALVNAPEGIAERYARVCAAFETVEVALR